MLSAAKHLFRAYRCFAALSMTWLVLVANVHYRAERGLLFLASGAINRAATTVWCSPIKFLIHSDLLGCRMVYSTGFRFQFAQAGPGRMQLFLQNSSHTTLIV
jgi:hypothetical protein